MKLINKRSLIACCALVVPISCATRVVARAASNDTECRKTSVAILGAGVAGITAAQALSNASISDFLIIDRNNYIGGRGMPRI